jgi:arylsulfatase A-like enzyme
MSRSCVFAVIVSAILLFSPDVRGSPAPHVIFVLADDLGYGDPGCYNADSKVPTPAIDRLAREGIRFTDAHTPSAVCTPTRYGILTGRYCWRTRLTQGVLQGYSPLLVETDRLTLPKLLAKRGYVTAGIGKWHLGLGNAKRVDYAKPLRPGPLDVVFDSYYGIPASLDMDPYLMFDGEHAVGEVTSDMPPGKSQRQGGNGFWRGGLSVHGFRHVDVMPETTVRAVELINARATAQDGKPLFLYFALSAPHDPWVPTAEFAGKSPAGPRGDAVAQVDAALGEILTALERSHIADDTLVIFTSDNGAHWTDADAKRWGGHRANANWRGQKADIHEAGHRVPFVARWPGHIKPNTTSDQTISLVDMLATLGAAAGEEQLPPDAGEDSYDVLPAMLGSAPDDKPVRGPLVLHSGHGMFAVRDGDWKFIDGLGSGGFTQPVVEKPTPGGPAGQLYDLKNDPAETKNLYAEKPDVVARMKTLLENYKADGRSR